MKLKELNSAIYLLASTNKQIGEWYERVITQYLKKLSECAIYHHSNKKLIRVNVGKFCEHVQIKNNNKSLYQIDIDEKFTGVDKEKISFYYNRDTGIFSACTSFHSDDVLIFSFSYRKEKNGKIEKKEIEIYMKEYEIYDKIRQQVENL